MEHWVYESGLESTKKHIGHTGNRVHFRFITVITSEFDLNRLQ